ncbi:MAG: rhomboid family intramembrane serine protease [Bacteroidetes bacterium]|jgi:membrane associated rhomboid family serine protease|nr:rhomboid family intramembrane serine protease [Bacteroidota bacterium]
MAYGNNYQRTTPIVFNLIIINALVFFAQIMFGGTSELSRVDDLFALHHYKSDEFRPYQLITYMFMHANFPHILFNMFSLWMFGSMLERVWGPKRFLIFYLICGVGAGLAQMGNYAVDFWKIDQHIVNVDPSMYQEFMRMSATVGASGAIMGLLAAFGYLFPNTELYIMFIPVPVKAKWAVLGFIALDVFGGLSRVPNDNVAHFAHVGGALIGFLIVLYWNKKNKQTFY